MLASTASCRALNLKIRVAPHHDASLAELAEERELPRGVRNLMPILGKRPRATASGRGGAARPYPVPWAASEASGDGGLTEALRLACSLRVSVAAAANGDLPASDVRHQLEALLPFLAARRIHPAVMKRSKIAGLALKGAMAQVHSAEGEGGLHNQAT